MELKAKNVQRVMNGRRWMNFQPIPRMAYRKAVAIAGVKNVIELKRK
jgi:hypothetical protein